MLGIGEDADAAPTVSRDLLRQELSRKEQLVRDFQEAAASASPTAAAGASDETATAVVLVEIDLQLISDREHLVRLVAIYAALIDLQLAVNVLAEIAYVMKLLNANYVVTDYNDHDVDKSKSANLQIIEKLFRNAHNCVFFGCGVLDTQQHILMRLDLATLTVLLHNERLQRFANDPLLARLRRIYNRRSELIAAMAAARANSGGVLPLPKDAVLNVSYQQDIDTKNNFPSVREFGAFNKQRDQFYAILGVWQQSHYIQSWSCANELGTKVVALLRLADHPVNMYHLAKLFVSQLLLSCTFVVSSIDNTKI